MLETYAPSLVVLLLIVMLVALVILAVILASMDPRGLLYNVVGLMGMTSLVTACLVALFILLLACGVAGRPHHDPGYDTVPASESVTTRDEGTIGTATSSTEMEGIAPLPPGQLEQRPTCIPTLPSFDGLSAREVSGEGQ